MNEEDRSRLEEWQQIIDTAEDMVSDLCHGRKSWQMSIPVQENEDSDTVIGNALLVANRLLSLLSEKDRKIERLRRHMKWALDSARMWMRNCRWNVIPKWEEAEQREKKSHERAKQLLHCVKQAEADQDRWKKRAERYKKALRAIRNYKPIEVLKDEFAYDRMVKSYRDAAHAALVDEK